MSTVEAHAEIERKYAVADGAAVPDLTVDGAAVAQPTAHLEAFYYDTDDDTLLRARIALRRRSGGTDAGWHLKLPAHLGRLEMQAAPDPADPEAVPDGIATLIRSRVRGRALHPIARIATARTAVLVQDASGVDRVEFVDDLVTATDLSTGIARIWREWEVEQVGPDPVAAARMLELVEPRLLAAGASISPSPAKIAAALGGPAAIAERLGVVPDDTSTAGGVLRIAIAALAEDVHGGELAVLRNDDDAVHRLRKTIRRIRAVLRLRSVVGEHAELDAALAALGRALGASRDREVAATVLRELFEGLDREPGAPQARRRLIDGQQGDAEAKRQAAVAGFGSREHFAMLASVDALASGIAGPDADSPAGAVLPALITELAASATHKRHRSFRPRHRDRKAARSARDVAAVIGSVAPDALPDRVRTVERRARDLQDAIGDSRDAKAVGALLRTLSAEAAAAAENTFVYGILALRARDRMRARTHDARRAARALRKAVSAHG